MPRGQKSKLRAREKRRQARSETQGLVGAQTTAEKIEEAPASPTPVSGGTPPGSPTAGTRQKPQGALATSSPDAGASRPRSAVGAKGQVKKSKNSSQASTSNESSREDPLTGKVGMLMQFLLEKYNMKEPIMKADMLKLVNKKYKGRFPEILRRAAERLELVFGLDLKEVKPSGHSYTLVSKLDLTDDGSLSGGCGLPKNGLLMPLLGMIFLNGNRASEEETWEFLNILGIYDGKQHLIFGEPRKLITEDLVREKYLVYRQMRNSNPPRYEFLWGPKARAETSKMKVLEFLAKVNDTVPTAFPTHYEEALKDEEERAQARAAARARAAAKAAARSKVKSRPAVPPAPSEV
ncbi:Melanoma-associated antigen B1 [Camelus dromedarius]|uniref:Melanoma-associated antigen B1 n=1 Tax=Camelus dromedarius TaxID=9838 RepID=A0A5N4C3Y2_CAMDR|nr:melanoma-associated antigen B1 [Camelus dromedarius]KAB1253581.1 Melanoma-associated antigen B1 [Camelus dromedarius]